ncbi:MAG: hypothetical protein U1F36_01805 [Planctomycetota bacterium]
MKLQRLATLLVPFAVAALAPAQTVYDFNALNGNDTRPFTQLDGQDNWSEQTFNASNRLGVTATLSWDGSHSLQFQEVGPGYGSDASRINDGNWGYAAFAGTETQAFFQADVKVGYWGGVFALGHDTNNNGTIRGSETGELGVRFKIGTYSTVQLQLIAANGTATTTPLAPLGITGGHWVRIRVVMDLAANAGAGSGSLWVQDITAGQTFFTPAPGLQGIPLGLNPGALDARNATLWDAVWLHFEGATYGLDNILVGASSAAAIRYESGCGSPALELQGRALPVLGGTASTATINLPANALAGVALIGFTAIDPGLDLSGAGLTGCRLAVAPATSGDLTLGAGSASFALSVPNAPALLGASVYLQSAVVAPGVNLASVLTSNGLRWVIGRN